jgi:sec-independent protein translocase protein TatA
MNTIFAWAPGGIELVLILGAILILFGSKKIPEFAKGLGQGIREFKKATREVTDEIQNAADDAPAQQRKAPAPATASRPPEDQRVVSQSPPKPDAF